MKKTPPRTPFSTALSGSARETELRLRHIFSGPRKRPPWLFLALVFAACLLCGNLVSCQVAQGEKESSSSQQGLPEGSISIPEDAGSGQVLQLLLSGGASTSDPELCEAFTRYYSEHPYELRSLPRFSPDQPPDWDDLTFYIAILESTQRDSAADGLSAQVFREFVQRYFGTLDYTDRNSGFLTYEDGFYTYTGWDTNGATFYRLTGLSCQDGVFTASFDGVEFWETDFFEEDFFAEEDPISQNMKAVRQAIGTAAPGWFAMEECINALLLEEDYAQTFTVSEQVQISFSLSGNLHHPLVYLSCARQRLD